MGLSFQSHSSQGRRICPGIYQSVPAEKCRVRPRAAAGLRRGVPHFHRAEAPDGHALARCPCFRLRTGRYSGSPFRWEHLAIPYRKARWQLPDSGIFPIPLFHIPKALFRPGSIPIRLILFNLVYRSPVHGVFAYAFPKCFFSPKGFRKVTML